MSRHPPAPMLAFGTWPLSGDEAERAVGMALDAGYRHIDTAQMYGNEREVGRAVAASGLERDAVFVTTKVDPSNLGADRFLPSVRRSLDALGVEAVDLLLIHWPPREAEAMDAALDALGEAAARGWARRVGVSNFTIAQMEHAVRRVSAPVTVNQVEFHPLLDQSRLLRAAGRLGITLFAYSSLAKGRVLDVPEIAALARAKGVAGATLVLAWTLAKGVGAVTMTRKRENAEANLAAASLALALTPEDIATIDAQSERNLRLLANTPWAPDWD